MYEIGDKLRIRQWDDMVSEYGINSLGGIVIEEDAISFIPQMKQMCGEDFTVSRIDGKEYFSEEGTGGIWRITAGMLEPREETPEIKYDELMEVLNI